MKTIFKDFINENKYELSYDQKDYDFLVNICERVSYDQFSMTFFLKDILEIGTIGKYKMYLNYISINHYEKKPTFWFLYNKKNSELYGTEWDFSVIYEENGVLLNSKNEEIKFVDNLYKYVADTIRNYDNLENWISEVNEVNEKHRQNTINRQKKTKLNWEERIEMVRFHIKHDKLLNRRKIQFEQKTLDDMLSMGEKEFDKQQSEYNRRMLDIMNDLDLEK